MTPNWFATIALLAWPLVAVWLYQTRPINQATLWTILGANLLLPVGTGLKLAEGIPDLDKGTIPNLAALVGCLLCAKRPLRFWNGFGLPEVLLLMLVIGPFITSEMNGDSIFIGSTFLPAVGHYDALSAVVAELLFVLPFFLGRQLFRRAADHGEILRTLVMAGLLYSLPIMFEVRMSPQLHNWVYGYYPTDFQMAVRGEGFRPMVFIGHGLGVAFFAMMTVVAAAALWRARLRVWRLPPAGTTAYLAIMLILCKSLGSIIYGAVLAPLVRWARPVLQVRIAMVLAIVAILYPALRLADLVPTKAMVEAATSISADRAQSLQFRFDNEDQLLARASERILFGWGRWGRSRVYANYGRDISVTDGRWIVTLGQFGLFGFLAEFGLLALPLFRAASAIRLAESERDGIFLAAVSLIVAITMIDLLPNSTLSPFTWLLAGALLGRAEALRSAAPQLRRSNRLAAVGRVTEAVRPQVQSAETRLRAPQTRIPG